MQINGRIGIDISIIMHRKMATKSGSAVVDMDPEVPLFEALRGVMKDLRFLKQTCGKDVTVFFDGRAHPMKAAEEMNRRQNRARALEELKNIYQEALPGSYDTVKMIRQKLAHRREDFTDRIANECNKLGISVV